MENIEDGATNLSTKYKLDIIHSKIHFFKQSGSYRRRY